MIETKKSEKIKKRQKLETKYLQIKQKLKNKKSIIKLLLQNPLLYEKYVKKRVNL